MATMSVNERQVLLSIRYEISKDDVVAASPSLANKVALQTADYGIDEIAAVISSEWQSAA